MLTSNSRHEQLLDELCALVLAEGFRHLTLAELAARLRCSKSTLYSLGQTKEQVMVHAVRHFFRAATGQVERDLQRAIESSEDPIVAYLRAIATALRPASAAFMDDVARHQAAREVYERNTVAAAERVVSLIAMGVLADEYREVHAAFVADLVTATMQRINSGAVFTATGLRDAQAYDQLAELVLDGIRSHAA